MITINGNEYSEKHVKLTRYLLLILGILIMPLSLLITLVYPLPSSIALAVGTIILYMSHVYARALKNQSTEFDMMNLVVIALMVIIPPAGLILMFVKKSVKKDTTKVMITILAVVWALWLLLCYAYISKMETTDTASKQEATAYSVEAVTRKAESQTTIAAASTSASAENTTEATTKENITEAATQEAVTVPANTEDVQVPVVVDTEPEAQPVEAAISDDVVETQDNQVDIASDGGASSNDVQNSAGNNMDYDSLGTTASSEEYRYVLNTSTKKIHRPTCKDVKKIKEGNERKTNEDYNSLIAQKYTPCGHCNPN